MPSLEGRHPNREAHLSPSQPDSHPFSLARFVRTLIPHQVLLSAEVMTLGAVVPTFLLTPKNTMAWQYIEVNTQAHITTITINRPEVRNALHPPANHELGLAFDAFSQDDDQWIAIITGKGDKAFSAGNDLKATAAGTVFEQKRIGGFGGLTERWNLTKPVIAAINGVALGGGFETALACDLVVAVEHAIFGLPEPRVGLVARSGVHRLMRKIPQNLAMEMILTGKPITAQKAQALGLVNQVVKTDALMQTALSYAHTMLECAPLSLRLSKQMALNHAHQPLWEAIPAHSPLAARFMQSQDKVEGPKAFAEKRKPNWQGK